MRFLLLYVGFLPSALVCVFGCLCLVYVSLSFFAAALLATRFVPLTDKTSRNADFAAALRPSPLHVAHAALLAFYSYKLTTNIIIITKSFHICVRQCWLVDFASPAAPASTLSKPMQQSKMQLRSYLWHLQLFSFYTHPLHACVRVCVFIQVMLCNLISRSVLPPTVIYKSWQFV